MRVKENDGMAVSEFNDGMMVFLVGNIRHRLDKGTGLAIVGKAKPQTESAVGILPGGQLGSLGHDLGQGQRRVLLNQPALHAGKLVKRVHGAWMRGKARHGAHHSL